MSRVDPRRHRCLKLWRASAGVTHYSKIVRSVSRYRHAITTLWECSYSQGKRHDIRYTKHPGSWYPMWVWRPEVTKVTIDRQWEQTGDPIGSRVMLFLCSMVGKRTCSANGTHYPMDNGSTRYHSIIPFHCKTDENQEIKRLSYSWGESWETRQKQQGQ